MTRESPGQPVEDRLPVLGAARGDGAVLATMQQDERLAGAGLVVARLDTTSSTEAGGVHGGMLPAGADAGNRRAANIALVLNTASWRNQAGAAMPLPRAAAHCETRQGMTLMDGLHWGKFGAGASAEVWGQVMATTSARPESSTTSSWRQSGEEARGASQVGPFDYCPRVGFREYWYPGVWAAKVGRKRPVKVRMLGEDIVPVPRGPRATSWR